MYYDYDAIITKTWLSFRPKALRPIGITDKSDCWGIVVPTTPGAPHVPHLLISEFHPKYWHSLFRLIVRLKDEPRIIVKLAETLRELNFNILSNQCAPSGYRHVSWNIIGEPLDQRDEISKELSKIIKDCFYKNVDALAEKNYEFRKRLTNEITLKMLQHWTDLKDKIREKNKTEKFLHERLNRYQTLLYWIEDYNKKEFEIFRPNLSQAVEGRWLEQLAVYRIYSEAQKEGNIDTQAPSENSPEYLATWDNPIRFKYNAATSTLEPQSETDKRKYKAIVGACVSEEEQQENIGFPLKGIAAFNPQEHFVRIILPEKKTKNNRIYIQIKYEATLKKNTNDKINKAEFVDISSIGLLHEIAKKIADRKINLSYLSNSVLSYSENTETGKFSLIGTPDDLITTEMKQAIRDDLKEIDDDRKNVRFEDSKVNKYGAKVIFVSTKFNFLKVERPDLEQALTNLAEEYGFNLLDGNPQLKSLDSSDMENQAKILEDYILNSIKDSDAFLQIYPKSLDKEKEKQTEWLLFELGVARGAGIPYEICVDEGSEYPNSIVAGKALHRFNISDNPAEIIKNIEKAIISLARACYYE